MKDISIKTLLKKKVVQFSIVPTKDKLFIKAAMLYSLNIKSEIFQTILLLK